MEKWFWSQRINRKGLEAKLEDRLGGWYNGPVWRLVQ